MKRTESRSGGGRGPASVLFLLLAITPLTAASIAQEGAGYQGSPSIAAARDLYERANYDEARAMLEALITAGSVNAEILWYRGLLEPDNAVANERYFSRIVNRYPRSEFADRARFRIARYHYDAGLYLTARSGFGDVAWRQGESPLGQEARYWRGMTWMHSINRADAHPDSIRNGLRYIKRTARDATEPNLRGMAIISVAEISLRLGEPDSSLVWSMEILEAPYLEDYHPRALAIQAEAYDALGDRDQARTIFQIVRNRFGDIWEGREARRWLVEDQERAVQARIDTMQATGAAVAAEGGMGEGNWTIRVGSFRVLKNATDLVLQLTAADYPAWNRSEYVNGVLWVKVYVGRFATRTEAREYGNRLRDAVAFVTDFEPVDLSRR